MAAGNDARHREIAARPRPLPPLLLSLRATIFIPSQLWRRPSMSLDGRILLSLTAILFVNGLTPRPSCVGQDRSTDDLLSTFVQNHCLDCHNTDEQAGQLSLTPDSRPTLQHHADLWEKVLRKVESRQMPPPDAGQPTAAESAAFVDQLRARLDRTAKLRDYAARSPTFRRMTRYEYQNSIRDLLGLDIDVQTLLPPDSEGHGFDNVNVSDLSPSLAERYVVAAERISRSVLGRNESLTQGDTFRIAPDETQEGHVAGLPLGTRGGMLVPYHFPSTGVYRIEARLTRDRDEHVEGLLADHECIILLDRREVARHPLHRPNSDEEHRTADHPLWVETTIKAGHHDIGVTFLKQPFPVIETKRQPLHVHFNRHRHPRLSPAVFEISVTGPHGSSDATDSPTRKQLFEDVPEDPEEQLLLAAQIFKELMRVAYRRPVTPQDLETPLQFFRHDQPRGFSRGIEAGLSAILVNPNFLFRIERDPTEVPANTAYNLDDHELASRLSFFLWSSLPDEDLLNLADEGRLQDPQVLAQQVQRMLLDPRREALVENFAAQWLYLRNLDAVQPDQRLFPDFDHNLRTAMRTETELLFRDVLTDALPLESLLSRSSTYLNERLAQHYAIPHIYGSRFRKVELSAESHRGGLLRQGSLLAVTSYATRTSPVVRGNWILENLLGSPAPPPPANIPALSESTVDSALPLRKRLEQHRADSACKSCHLRIDPLGFALENYDAVGVWRERDGGQPVDTQGDFPGAAPFVGVEGLETMLLQHQPLYYRTLTEKLLTYALGRAMGPADAPSVRKILDQVDRQDTRFSELVTAIVQSDLFRRRITE